MLSLFYNIKNSGEQEKGIHYSCEGRIEKFVLRHRRLSSLGQPHDAKRRSIGQIFISFSHTHDRFLYKFTILENWMGIFPNLELLYGCHLLEDENYD